MTRSSAFRMTAALVVALVATIVGGCGEDYQLPDLSWGPEPYTAATAADLAGAWNYYDENGNGFRLTLGADGKFTEEIFGGDEGIAKRVTGTWRLDGADLKFAGWQAYSAPGAVPTFWVFKNPNNGQIGIFGGEGERGANRWTAMSRAEPETP
ncbi:MAG: hypothetical protein JXL80_10260 [Planctomycetes bacterium]|nr:hypothetical protein [Planctomycetota bacterium]